MKNNPSWTEKHGGRSTEKDRVDGAGPVLLGRKVCDYFRHMGYMVHLVQMVVPDCTGSAFVLEFSWFLTHVNIYVIIL